MMKNLAIVAGATAGAVLFVWVARDSYGGQDDAGAHTAVILGATLGVLVGGWISAKIVDQVM